jgi:hypothetical protein
MLWVQYQTERPDGHRHFPCPLVWTKPIVLAVTPLSLIAGPAAQYL